MTCALQVKQVWRLSLHYFHWKVPVEKLNSSMMTSVIIKQFLELKFLHVLPWLVNLLSLSNHAHDNQNCSTLSDAFRIPMQYTMHVWRPFLIYYLFLKVAVGEVENFQSSISPGQSQSLSAAVKRHGSDSTGHVVEESNTVHLKLTHFPTTETGGLSRLGRRQRRQHTSARRVNKPKNLSGCTRSLCV